VTRYFAYGSNLVIERMRERGAPFRAARPAVLRGYRLVFDKRGFDGSARANVAPAPAGLVHGVVYELEDGGLDALAGFECGYDLVPVEVELQDAEGAARVPARVFVARPDRRTSAPPTRSYVALILQGVEQHGLPPEARAQVEQAARRPGRP
jgi:gamma-glutamyl AIG2-like cyclotransferase